jgi:hypothetical protein
MCYQFSQPEKNFHADIFVYGFFNQLCFWCNVPIQSKINELTRCESPRFDSRRIQISAWASLSRPEPVIAKKNNKKKFNVYLLELLQV